MSAAFREAVARFRAHFAPLDEYAKAVLDRLTSEEWLRHALPAFDVVPRERWPILLGDCLYAEREMREHKRIAEHYRRTVDKAEEVLKGLDAIAAFVERCDVVDEPAVEALAVLRARIANDRGVAARRRSQQSRKKNDPSAARSAALGWLAESVEKLSGKPNLRHAAALAEAVLDLDGVTEGAVRKAVRPSDRRARGLSIIDELMAQIEDSPGEAWPTALFAPAGHDRS